MAITAEVNYGTKQQHGLKWGIYRVTGDAMRIRTRELGGDVERLQDQNLGLVTDKDTLVVMGNIWVHKDEQERTRFRHPRLVAQTGATAWYWDNPQLPHLLYRGAWNPNGYKNWMRIVKNNTATQTAQGSGKGEAVINEQLVKITNGRHTQWQSIIGEHRACQIRSKTALLCPSGAGIFPNYYGLDKAKWIQQKTRELEKLGWRVILRDKPGRSAREHIHNGRLYQQLIAQNIGITVSIHSVGPVESLLAGVPALVEGRHAGGECATPYDEYMQTGNIRMPHQTDVEQWCARLLDDTFHKTEAYEGTWYDRV